MKSDPARRRRSALLALALGVATPQALAQSASTTRTAVPPDRALAVATAPTPTTATPAEPGDAATRGAELRRKCKEAWEQGRDAEAIALCEEALKLWPAPRTSYNLALAYEKVGRHADALAQFLRFKAGASPKELEERPTLDGHIDALRKRVALLKVRTNVSGARVLVRDALVGTQSADRPLEVSLNEGRAPVEILYEGYQPYRKDHTLQGGSSLELDVQLNRQAPPTTLGEKTKTVYVTSTPFWSQWWFWAGAGLLVAGGAATVYALSTEKAPSERGPVIPTAQHSGFSLRF
jgi:PEGA domain-containing protein